MNVCQVCDAEFTHSTWHPYQKTCSKKCRNVARGRASRGYPPKKQEFICVVCDNKFIQKRLSNTCYCTDLCKRLAMSRRGQGKPINGPRKVIRGTGTLTKTGYKIITRKHPNSTKRGQIMEHVYIMSHHLGRPLMPKETVHHKNGIRNDNRIENLELWSSDHGSGQRVEDKIKWAKDFLEQYGHKVIIQ